MATDTQDTLLHGQLQEGLWFKLMRAPSVSGAQKLCIAPRNEEERLAELRKCQSRLPPHPHPLRSLILQGHKILSQAQSITPDLAIIVETLVTSYVTVKQEIGE